MEDVFDDYNSATEEYGDKRDEYRVLQSCRDLLAALTAAMAAETAINTYNGAIKEHPNEWKQIFANRRDIANHNLSSMDSQLST